MTVDSHAAPIVILPGTDELNRGDQALVWQTRDIAERAGYAGPFYMLSHPENINGQSIERGISPLVPLLSHPGTRFRPSSNMKYNISLTLIWGAIALGDAVRSLLLLTRWGRWIVKPFLREAERRTLDTILASKACFVKGGGFIHSTASISDPYRAFYFLFHVFLALSVGKRVFVMPNSFGPFEGKLYRAIVRAALKRCSLVTARETISKDALAELGIDSKVFPDLAFGLHSRQPAEPTALAVLKSANPDKRVVGLTVRPYRFPGSVEPRAAYGAYVREMASFVSHLRAQNFLPVFIEHVISTGEHESDFAAITEITNAAEATGTPIVRVPGYSCAELKYLYGECDFVVGTRFHSVIFALSEGTPAMAIAYGGNKGVGIMRDADLEPFVIPIEEFSSELARERFELLSGLDDVKHRLAFLEAEYSFAHEQLIELVRAAG